MIRIFCLLFVMGIVFGSKAQSFCSLGTFEKIWVISHPFSANKARKIAAESIHYSDSISSQMAWNDSIGSGLKDAFRHAYWISKMSVDIGPKRALSLGRAHEKRNRRDILRKRKEDGEWQDHVSIEMDLYNNGKASAMAKRCVNCNGQELIALILSELKRGEFRIIKQDTSGSFLDIRGNALDSNEWRGLLKGSPRVLVPSTY